MTRIGFTGKVKELTERAINGKMKDVDYIMSHLSPDVTIATTKFVDYALSFVESDLGIKRMGYYLFNGTQMQRNYCALFFNRRGDWPIVKKAYEEGCIDGIQAFAR
jgi:hypothetical protein